MKFTALIAAAAAIKINAEDPKTWWDTSNWSADDAWKMCDADGNGKVNYEEAENCLKGWAKSGWMSGKSKLAKKNNRGVKYIVEYAGDKLLEHSNAKDVAFVDREGFEAAFDETKEKAAAMVAKHCKKHPKHCE